MEGFLQCTICGEFSARYCITCRSAAYCSVECQQADWRPHRLLCRSFQELSASSFAARPSTSHYLAIQFPMASRKPRLVWVRTREVNGEPGYFNPELDELLHVPGNNRYIGRGLHCVRGNILRGREISLDTLNIWYIDDSTRMNLGTNQSLHGTLPALVGDTWGEMIWKGPIVAVMKVGTEFDPRQVRDITLTAYRDAIDYLGYFRDGYGSMVDGIGARDGLSKRVMADRAGKVKGVRINCLGDQGGDTTRQLVQVDVPKTHPLFNLESDDPLDILECLEWEWVVKSYTSRREPSTRDGGEQGLDQNPLVRLLLLQVSGDDEEWGKIRERRLSYADGSVLVVDRGAKDLTVRAVQAVCTMIEQVVVPLVEQNQNNRRVGREKVLEAISQARLG
jgi:hypothetical protein